MNSTPAINSKKRDMCRTMKTKNLTMATMVATFLTLGAFSAAGIAALERPVVDTDAGKVQGTDDGKLLSWLGVPYAAAPEGSLRWMPPRAPEKWSGVKDASQFGNFCPQNTDLGVFGKAGGAEDCLNLNVYVSKETIAKGGKLPVLVWIHGGSLWVGAGRDYDASKLALKGNAVVVTINYRLGILGYFAHPELDKEGHRFANYGLMDQQFALEWVQHNISAFGGNPKDVTISGESSGGNSVMAHVVAPGSAGKFQHAVAMSGGAVALRFPTFGAPKPLDYAEKMGEGFAKAVGCTSDNQAACLRQLPLDKVLAMQTPHLINQVVIDGTVIPLHPGEAFRTGKFNHVTLINGTTRDEGTFFAGFPENENGIAMQGKGYEDAMKFFFGSLAEKVKKEYPADSYVTPSNAYAAAVTDMEFACPARIINKRASAYTPTYAYEFADRTAPSYLKPTSFALGAAHTYELSYLFPGFHGGAGIPVKLNALQEKLSDKMVTYWAQAGKAGERENEWPRYSPKQDNVMSLVLPGPVMKDGVFGREHHCDFWDDAGVY